jgi:hypothetical protein
MISSTADIARETLQDIQLHVFTAQMLASIIGEKAKYLTEKTYVDMRNTSTAKVIEAINGLIGVPNLLTSEMTQCLQGFSVNVQSFVLDRFLYADDYLSKLGTVEIFLEDQSRDFLRQCLIDFWDSRDQRAQWQ